METFSGEYIVFLQQLNLINYSISFISLGTKAMALNVILAYGMSFMFLG
jgi:hypothetical protein